jgi:hypothetical protein
LEALIAKGKVSAVILMDNRIKDAGRIVWLSLIIALAH